MNNKEEVTRSGKNFEENENEVKEISPEYSLEGLMLKLKLQYSGHLCKELSHWKRPWCWERLKVEEKGMTEDEMVGWHHQLDGHEFEWTPGLGDGSLACCSPWGRRVRQDWATEPNWTELPRIVGTTLPLISIWNYRAYKNQPHQISGLCSLFAMSHTLSAVCFSLYMIKFTS